ncbi:uncharacterized protein LOC131994738 [Stomoxys calcitrans]|uniref:uncharacterized protein LOC131994738 n=1 Tax=Stomoxys calcitrans TaxID=35570 RepID=UPI0027E2BED6|nr:uncharacterized protein LOC131994738 [Stomoxys calcitrans]
MLYDLHAKCVELSARTADNIREDKGLRWCCAKCKEFNVELYAFFKNTRSEFETINNELNNINAVPSNIEIPTDQQPSTSLVADYTRLNTLPPSGLLTPSNTAALSSAPSASALPSGTTTFYTPQATPKLPTTTPKPLKVAPNKKAIFAAKFAAETSTDGMLFYIKPKIDIDVELSVYKFKCHERQTRKEQCFMCPKVGSFMRSFVGVALS